MGTQLVYRGNVDTVLVQGQPRIPLQDDPVRKRPDGGQYDPILMIDGIKTIDGTRMYPLFDRGKRLYGPADIKALIQQFRAQYPTAPMTITIIGHSPIKVATIL